MNKHTPGPWHWLGGAIGIAWEGQGGEAHQLFTIANLEPPSSDNLEEWKANARLLAAAPELLTALVALLDELDPDQFHYEAERAVIAKATGGKS